MGIVGFELKSSYNQCQKLKLLGNTPTIYVKLTIIIIYQNTNGLWSRLTDRNMDNHTLTHPSTRDFFVYEFNSFPYIYVVFQNYFVFFPRTWIGVSNSETLQPELW